MSEAFDAPKPGPRGWGGGSRRRSDGSSLYAALDLGTNNCRLLIARPAADGFRVSEAYSNIVRLGEGLSHSGELQERAMERALAALKVCADKIARRRCDRVRAVATQACRSAVNGAEFVARVKRETGLDLVVISPQEEAHLSVAGCLDLLDRDAHAALVLDVGGGSTELSWIDLRAADLGRSKRRLTAADLPLKAWISIPIGVVTLAERIPEDPSDRHRWYRAMVEAMKAMIVSLPEAEALRPAFQAGRAQLVGTSGAITSLAGLHLGLNRYDRRRVDGLWLSRAACQETAARLLGMTVAERAKEPCIGPQRADLVLAGAAILQAVQEAWPCERVRVADRGLREGLLMALMAEDRRGAMQGGPRQNKETTL